MVTILVTISQRSPPRNQKRLDYYTSYCRWGESQTDEVNNIADGCPAWVAKPDANSDLCLGGLSSIIR